MKRIYQIKFSKINKSNFYAIFKPTRNIPNLLEGYYVLSPELISLPSGFGVTTEGLGVYDSKHQLLGDIRIQEFSAGTIVSFYLEDEKYEQALMVFIESSIDDMKFAGFPIISFRDCRKNTVEKMIDDKPYIPKKKSSLDKWKKVYKEICEYKKELSESSDWETFIPKMEDYKTRIEDKIHLEYSIKTIRRIIKAGDEGLLN